MFKLGQVYTSSTHLFVETVCETSARTVFVVCPPLAFDVSQLRSVKLLAKPVESAEIQTSEPAINYGCETGQYAEIVPTDKSGRRFVSQLTRLSSFVGKIQLCVLSAGYFGYASGSGVEVYACPDIQGDTRWYTAISINDIIEGFSLVPDFETKLVLRLRSGMSMYKQTCVQFVSGLEQHLARIRALDVGREKCAQQLKRLGELLSQARLDLDAAVNKMRTTSDAGLRSIMVRTVETSKVNIQTLETKILNMDLLHRQTVTELERVVFENTLFIQSVMDNLK